MRCWIVGVVAAVTLAGAAAQAHHSISGVYASDREAKVDGVVTRFRFARPHPWIDLRETSSGQTWRLEMDDLGELEDIGFAADTLEPGDRVVVTGRLARREAHSMYIERLERPADGFGYQQHRSRPRLRTRTITVR